MTLDEAIIRISSIAEEKQFNCMVWGIRCADSYIWRKYENERLTIHLYTSVSKELFESVKGSIVGILKQANYVVESSSATDQFGIGEDIIFVPQKIARQKKAKRIIEALKNSSILKWVFGILATVIAAVLIKWLV